MDDRHHHKMRYFGLPIIAIVLLAVLVLPLNKNGVVIQPENVCQLVTLG